VGWGMIMKNKPYLISANIITTAAVNIGLNILFIPLLGILGAALATLVSYIVWNALKMYFSAKLYDLFFDLKRLGFTTVCGLSLYFIGLAIGTSDSLFTSVSVKLLVLFSYPFFFWFFNFFNEEEKTKIRAFMASSYRYGLRVISSAR
jgi:O-antigen/teichoic acid export membrane protein